MKFQRKIAALLCCLTFMGTLSFDALSVQAALCKGHVFLVDNREYTCYEEDGHYRESGLMCQCVNCDY